MVANPNKLGKLDFDIKDDFLKSKWRRVPSFGQAVSDEGCLRVELFITPGGLLYLHPAAVRLTSDEAGEHLPHVLSAQEGTQYTWQLTQQCAQAENCGINCNVTHSLSNICKQ